MEQVVVAMAPAHKESPTLYQILKRHGWGKLAPDKSYPQANPATREALKKLPERLIDEMAAFVIPRPLHPNVSGRRTFRWEFGTGIYIHS